LRLVPVEENMFHLTFDDGLKGIILNTLPILKEYNVPATFFVPVGLIAETGGWCPPYKPRLQPMVTWIDLVDCRRYAAALEGRGEAGDYRRGFAVRRE
jgi:hypothetical protein